MTEIVIRVKPKMLRWAAAGILLLTLGAQLGSESFVLSTYYPAPSGVYNQMITTGNTFLNRDGAGKVGIATTAPQATLDVNGLLKVGAFAANPSGGVEGAIYYNTATKTFMGFQNGAWSPMGGSSGGGGGFSSFQVFDDPSANGSSGNSFTVPQGVNKIMVEVWGGGGGGAGSGTTWGQGPGAGGGGGAYAKQIFAVTAGASYPATVGPGGGGSGVNYNQSPGSPGGNSSFDTLLSAGGGGGGAGGNGAGGVGGTSSSSSGRIVMPGQNGGGGGICANGGAAGNGGLGGLCPAGVGQAPGGGGSGGGTQSGNGGSGANGRVIVWW